MNSTEILCTVGKKTQYEGSGYLMVQSMNEHFYTRASMSAFFLVSMLLLWIATPCADAVCFLFLSLHVYFVATEQGKCAQHIKPAFHPPHSAVDLNPVITPLRLNRYHTANVQCSQPPR